MSVNGLIKKRRIYLNLTLKEIADAVGVSEGTVSKWESGNISNMRCDRMSALAAILDISPMELLESCSTDTAPSFIKSGLSKDEQRIISTFRSLNDEGRKYMLFTVDMMSESDRYKKDNSPGMGKKA